MKIFLSFFLILSLNSYAEKIDNMRLAKKLRYVTGIQIDMNVEADDRCVNEQVSTLLDQIKGFKRKTRKNLKAFIDNHFTGIEFSPTQKVGSLSGSLGKVTLMEEELVGNVIKKVHRKNVTERVVWDTRVYEGEENVNSHTLENGKIKFLVKSADKRFLQYDFLIFQKKMNQQGKVLEVPDWSNKFRHPFDEVSGLEVSDESSKREMGSFDCGKPVNWFDFGFEASF